MARGTDKPLRSRFAAVRIRVAHGDLERSTPHEPEWLLIEWPQHEEAPTKYWLSTLAESTPKAQLVRAVMTRWRIERDYQNLKQELGSTTVEVGVAFTIMQRSASQHTAFSSLIKGVFPPPIDHADYDSRNLPYPTISDPAVLPIRVQRHSANSIETVRARIVHALIARLSHCPSCHQQRNKHEISTLQC